jgi:LacI family transcriptional regulator
MDRPTRNEVAKLAGVSTATVSRVLNNLDGTPVSDKLRARVLAAVEEIGYRPNGAARALASGRTHIVALWAADCFTPFYAMIGRHVAQQGVKRHYQVLVNSLRHYVGDEDHASPSSSWHVDGVLACDSYTRLNRISSLYKLSTPVVGLGTFHDTAHDFVGVDLYTGATQAMHHLLGPGCRRVAYLHNDEATYVRDPRTRAYMDTMQEAGLETECIALPGQQRPVARQTIVDYVRACGLPEAIFCINDDVAIGCYRGLRELGVRCPDDVALVGCDGLPELEYLDIPLSTIIHPVENLCEQAWDFLERRIQEPSAPIQQITLPTQLVIRASSQRG